MCPTVLEEKTKLAIALDPVICNILFTINLILHLRRPSSSSPWQNPVNNMKEDELPLVSIMLPMLKERRDSIFATVNCLADQTYPQGKMDVLFIVEPDDPTTKAYVEEAAEFLREKAIDSKILTTDGKLRMKPHAMNRALEEAKGKILCVYDADDSFPKDQMEKAVNLLIENGYDCVQPKIYRKRESLSGKFLMIDTFTWNRKFLPAIYNLSGVFPLSGEGFYAKKEAIQEVGGFPEVLTEDAYLSILLAEKGKKLGLLDSELTELAPRGWRSHFRQRLRWFRGYITCLGRVLKAKMPLKQKLGFSIPFLAPITCAFSPFMWTFMALYWITWAFFPTLNIIAPWMTHWLYSNGILYWSIILAYIGNPIVIFSLMHSLAATFH